MLRRGMIGAVTGFDAYATYAAYVNGLSVDKTITDSFLSQFGAYGNPVGLCRWSSPDNTTTSGDMFGSPYAGNRAVRHGVSTGSRMLLHAIENASSLKSGANVVLINSSSYTGTFDSVLRNGYTSIASGSTSGLTINWIVYWDTLLGKARKFDAVTQTYSDYIG